MQHTSSRARVIRAEVWVVSLLGLYLSSTSVFAQRLTLIDLYPWYTHFVTATSVSEDGTVVACEKWLSGTPPRSFPISYRWTARSGHYFLGLWRTINGMSADGTVLVGYVWSFYDAPGLAIRWTEQSGWVSLCSIESNARNITPDGTVIVGETYSDEDWYQAFYWTEPSGLTYIGASGNARDINPTKTAIVGQHLLMPYRWTPEGGVQPLAPPPEYDAGDATGVSADGSTVVGNVRGANGWRAYRWSEATGMRILRDDGVLDEFASDVSGDGRTVVGSTVTASGSYAYRWTESGGVEDLNATYAHLLTNLQLVEARAISSDGRYIVGSLTMADGLSNAFLLDTWREGDTNGDGCIDDSDLLAVLFAFGTPGTGYTRHEDINKDGIVDDADLLIVLFNFGSGC